MPNQPPPTRKATIHGVEVTQTILQNKPYTTVDGRVKIAEQADPSLVRRVGAGYHVVSVEFVQIGERWAYHCMVKYPVGSGVIKPGTDFIDLKDASGVAKAETSAIGRALGLHGIAIEESVASADEMARVQPGEAFTDAGEPDAREAAQSEHTDANGSIADMQQRRARAENQMELAKRMRGLSGVSTEPDAEAWLERVVGRHIGAKALKEGTSSITVGECKRVLDALGPRPVTAG